MSAFHLCIDMQVSAGATFAPDEWAGLRNTIASLTHTLQGKGIKSAFFGYIPNMHASVFGTYKDYGHYFRRNDGHFSWQSDAIDFRFDPTDLIGIKTTISAANVPGLRKYLEENRIRTIILSGVTEGPEDHTTAEHCVRETARGFRAGYEVIIAAEATNGAFPSFYRGLSPEQKLLKRQRDFQKMGVHVLPIREIWGKVGAPPAIMRRSSGYQPGF